MSSAGDELARSFAFCREVSRREAANFYHGMKLTPEPKRAAMFAVYAWMREADDLADNPGTLAEKRARIEAFRVQTMRVFDSQGRDLPEGMLWPAVARTIQDYHLTPGHFMEMLDGQMLDQEKTAYATFGELYDYCYKVASTVGLICIEIWGYRGTQPRQWAIERGIAFQLTNILRDLREDAQRGRVYLPAGLLGVERIDPEMLRGAPTPELVRAVRRLGLRAAVYYRRSAPLERELDRDGVACSLAMCRIYHGLLEHILAEPQRVFTTQRVRLSAWRKVWIGLWAMYLAKRRAGVAGSRA